MQDDVSRPVTLYVEKIEPNPGKPNLKERRRVSVIDLQLSAIHATQLIEYLRERKDNLGPETYINIRFLGKLIHQ